MSASCSKAFHIHRTGGMRSVAEAKIIDLIRSLQSHHCLIHDFQFLYPQFSFVRNDSCLIFRSKFHNEFYIHSSIGDESVEQHREIKENNNNFRDICDYLYVHYYKHEKIYFITCNLFVLSFNFFQASFVMSERFICANCDNDLDMLRRYKQNINALFSIFVCEKNFDEDFFSFENKILNPRIFFEYQSEMFLMPKIIKKM